MAVYTDKHFRRQNDKIFLDGKAVGSEVAYEDYYDQQYSRYDRLVSRNKEAGTITINQLKYLDYEQSQQINEIVHKLDNKGYGAGDALDWAMHLAVRPTGKSNAVAFMSYGLRSAFINVSDGGVYDGLFNRLVAEGISVAAELLIDMWSTRASEEQAETMVRKGFEAVSNARKKGISRELLEAMDDHFDATASAIEDMVEKKQGIFANVKESSVPEISRRVGESIARKLTRLTKVQKQELIDDPVKAFDFYNDHLKRVGITLHNDWIDKYRNTLTELRTARGDFEGQMEKLAAENKVLKKKLGEPEEPVTEAGKDSSDLGKTRSWMQYLLGKAGRG